MERLKFVITGTLIAIIIGTFVLIHQKRKLNCYNLEKYSLASKEKIRFGGSKLDSLTRSKIAEMDRINTALTARDYVLELQFYDLLLIDDNKKQIDEMWLASKQRNTAK